MEVSTRAWSQICAKAYSWVSFKTIYDVTNDLMKGFDLNVQLNRATTNQISRAKIETD
jgi:hypothetical protein